MPWALGLRWASGNREKNFQPVSSQSQNNPIVTWHVSSRYVSCHHRHPITELSRRMLAYSNVAKQISVFRECLSDDGNNIRSAAERLSAAYENDPETDITTNSSNFTNCWKLICDNYRLSNHICWVCRAMNVHKLITGANLQTVFPNIEVRLRLGTGVVCFSFFFWLRVLDKAKYSTFESMLRSSIVSYRVRVRVAAISAAKLFGQ